MLLWTGQLTTHDKYTPLMPACPSCGEQNPERARFCLSCGRPLSEEGAGQRAAETRRRVTVLFTDVVGSTPLGERLDPEALREVMQRYFDAMRVAIERHEGTVEKFIGDAVMAVFGIPQIHEDDALRAVRAAMDMQSALVVLNRDLQARWGVQLVIRTGINTGEVVAGEASTHQSLATGDVVNTAARLEQVAGADEVLIGPATHRLVRHAVLSEQAPPVELKGKAEPMSPWRVLGVGPMTVEGRHFDSPLVGRDRQLHILLDAASRSRDERAPQLVTVLGLAGVGKSRLVHEFLGRLTGATIIRGRCLSYGDTITYWPLAEALRSAAGITDEDPPEQAVARLTALVGAVPRAELIARRVAAIIGAIEDAVPSGSQETFWAVRRLFEAMASRAPLVVVFDDIHWGTPTFLDLVEHVADWARDAPILLLTLARPELLEVRPSWGGGKLNATTLLLEPLDEQAVREILANLAGADLPEALFRKIASAAEGNPLFVEELVSMLADEGVLVGADGSFQVARTPDEIPVPATIELLLAARLDRLPVPERAALGRGAVIGRQFGASEVGELTPLGDRPELLTRLLALVRKELVRQEEEEELAFGDEPGEELRFRFRHQLVRDAAYEALPKHERARLHELFAGWLERTRSGQADPLHEVVGHHLAEAARLSGEIGGNAPAAQALARRAAAHLEAAAQRASAVGDMDSVIRLLERAVDLRGPDDLERLRSLPVLAAALARAGRTQEAVAAVETVLAAPDAPPETRAAALEQTQPLFQQGMGGAEVGPRVEEALAIRRRIGEPAGIAQALAAQSELNWFVGHLAEAQRLAEEGLTYARDAGDLGLQARLLGSRGAAHNMSRGSNVDTSEAMVRESREFARANGILWLEAAALGAEAFISGMRGDRLRAAELDDQFRSMSLELGNVLTASANYFDATADWWAGDAEEAVRKLRRVVEALQAMGERGYLSTAATELATALLDLGRADEAEVACDIAAEAGASDDIVTQVELRGARARILAHRSRLAEAEVMARDAVAQAEASEYFHLPCIAHLALGDVLLVMGRRADAANEWGAAIAEEERHGNQLLAARLHRELAAIEAGQDPRPGPSTT